MVGTDFAYVKPWFNLQWTPLPMQNYQLVIYLPIISEYLKQQNAKPLFHEHSAKSFELNPKFWYSFSNIFLLMYSSFSCLTLPSTIQ